MRQITNDQQKENAMIGNNTSPTPRNGWSVLLDLHFYLFPEQYPPERARKHEEFRPDEHTCFEWKSETLDAVAYTIISALVSSDDPEVEKVLETWNNPGSGQ